MGGFRFTPSGISGVYNASNVERRNTPVTMFEDTLSWTKGSHALSFGGSWQNVGAWRYWKYFTPSVGFGLDSAYDPAYIMFDATNGPKNLPQATQSQISSAASIYASNPNRCQATLSPISRP